MDRSPVKALTGYGWSPVVSQDRSGLSGRSEQMNWKPLAVTALVLFFVGSIAYGAIWGSDDIDTQVGDVKEAITTNVGDETWHFRKPTCPRFDALDDGEKITCTATAVDTSGKTSPAKIVVTLQDCHRAPGDTGAERCDFTSRWKV